MPSIMVYLALSACATTAVGFYAGPETWEWAEDRWDDSGWGDGGDCDRRAHAGVQVGSVGVHAGGRSRCGSSCERDEAQARRCG